MGVERSNVRPKAFTLDVDNSLNATRRLGVLLGRDHNEATSPKPTIFLCRHGETALNTGKRLRGLLNPDLDAAGRQQAEELAVTLGPTRPHAIIASPLKRTRQTADAIAAACGLTTEVSDDLLDRDYGLQSGHLVDEVNGTWKAIDNAPGVEPWASVLARAQSALAKATARSLNGDVRLVLVSHDAINASLLAFLAPKRWPTPGAVRQPTGCLNVLQRVGGSWTVLMAGMRPPSRSPVIDQISEHPKQGG
jgi:broad specificity phosphatase PhoE